MTTDTGIDLVAYPRKSVIDWPEKRPATIQVKTSSERGKIGEWVEWNVTESCPADYIAAVDLKRNRLWLFKFSDFKAVAKRAGKGQLRLWWPTPDHDWAKAPRHETEFAEYEMENGLHKAFGI